MTDVKKALLRVSATREGGAVERRHSGPKHRPYDVAQHSFNAVSLLLILYPGEPTVNLIKTMLWHDCAERWLGDVPAPAKFENGNLKEHYENAEESILKRLGLLPDLYPYERQWVRALDSLELWLWCREEEALGNVTVKQMKEACEATLFLMGLDETLPKEIKVFFDRINKLPYERLSDFFQDIAHKHGLGEA